MKDASAPHAPNSGLSDFDLLTLHDETGEAPESRVRDVASALSIFTLLLQADETSAINRSRRDAMFDGAPPYDQQVLNATGQGGRTNLNWNEAQRYLDISMSGFIDLNSSLDRLFRLTLREGDPARRDEYENIISEELTHTFRDWPAFYGSYLRLCTEFTKQGVGVAYFDNPKDWRYRVSGLSDFLIPRQTEASEEAIEVATSRRQYLLHELYALISDEEVAEKSGWNVEEIKRVILRNATNTGKGSGTHRNWEALQAEIKNNDILSGVQNTSVSIIHMWVREFDGTVTLLMFAESNPKEFILRQPKFFSRPEEAFILFTFGVGSNGTYHSIRGLGQRIFNHIQTSNRMRCHRVDAAMLAGSVMIQPETQRALADLSFTMYGPYSVLSPNVKVIEKASPNLTQSMDPALADLENQLAANVDISSITGNASSVYRNVRQVEHDLAVSSSLTGSTLHLFYAGWSRLLREVDRRIITGDAKDPAIKDFFRRCEARGVPKDLVKSIDHSKTSAMRSIGSGSAANRLMALREVHALSGGYDDVGRRNLIRDLTAERVGRDLVDRYAPPSPEPRQSSDSKVAYMENQLMQSGSPVPVFDTELHGSHMMMHAPLLQELIDGIQDGSIDPLAVLDFMRMIHDHCAEHTHYLSMDPAASSDAAAYRQMLQMSEMVITNFERQVEAQRRKESQEALIMDDQGQQDIERDMKLEAFRLKQEITAREAEQRMEIKQRAAEQDLALKDAARAAQLEGTARL